MRLLVRMLAESSAVSQLVATGRNTRLGAALGEDRREVRELPWQTAYDPRAVIGLLRHLRGEPGPRDRLLLHAHDSHALAIGLIASRLLRVPLVATRRSVTPPGSLWRRADRVIAISRAVEGVLLAAAVPPMRIRCIPSAVPVDALRARSRPHEVGAGQLLAIGALTAEKGHATLIEAFALLATRVPGARLRILGDGPERPALAARIERLGMASRIELAGERDDAIPCLTQAAIFVQPSRREALGTAVLEAMALGIPVVASRTGGLPELLDPTAGLLVPPDDPATLAAAIESLIRDPQLGARLVAAASVRVLDFDAVGMADGVAEVYRSALGDT